MACNRFNAVFCQNPTNKHLYLGIFHYRYAECFFILFKTPLKKVVWYVFPPKNKLHPLKTLETFDLRRFSYQEAKKTVCPYSQRTKTV